MTLRINNKTGLQASPKAIIFDTDNTLYPYDEADLVASKAATQKACKLLGISANEFFEAFNLARDEVKEQLGATASSHSRLLYFQRAIEMLGMRTQLLMTLDVEQTYWREFLNASRLFPNVKEYICDLRYLGINTAIITDLTSQIQFRKIIYFGLDDYFDYVVTSEEAGHDKPHKAPFEIALKKLNVDPKLIWMIGDNPVSDIQGAQAFGMTTLQKCHKGVKVAKGKDAADAEFDHFADLRKLFVSKGWIQSYNFTAMDQLG